MDYDIIAKSYNKLYKEEQLKKLKIIETLLKINKDSNLLDVGCGTGISTNFFKCKTKGIDPSKNMLKLGGGNLIHAQAESLPFKDKEFDIAISVTAIHNFKDQAKALNEILRVSKPKAQIVITLLKKSPKYNSIKKLIKEKLKVKEIDEEKDTIFYRI